jgi:hypothetical protein
LRYLWMEGGWVDRHMLPSLLLSLKRLGRAVIKAKRMPHLYIAGFVRKRGQEDAYIFERGR